MKLLIVLIGLVIFVLVCDKYEQRLPVPVNWIYALWKKFAHVLGIIMTFVILTILWIVGFGVYAMLLLPFRYFARYKREPASFWVESEPTTLESMKHQF